MSKPQRSLAGFASIFDIEESVPAAQQASERLRMLQASRREQRADFLEWAIQVPEPKAGKLDFERFPFQKELYTDAAYDREVVVMKSTQVGVSAYLVRWVMFFADTRGQVALYLFPKERQIRDFSDQRLRPLLSTEKLAPRVPASFVNHKTLKQIGLGYVYLRGSESTAGLESIDADCLAMDEYDFLVPDNIPQAEHRLDGSLDPKIRRVGFPTFPEYGVSKFFEASDQRRWNVKCEACNEWQDIDFWNNLDQERVMVVCRACRKPLDVRRGQWVATYPDRDVKGYHIPRLIVHTTDLQKIIEESQATNPSARAVFHNRALGLPFASDENRLAPTAITAAQRDDIEMVSGVRTDNLVTMGVDVASARALNVSISEHVTPDTKKTLWLGLVDSFDELSNLMERYCLAPETRVLYADLSWRKLGDAKVGDKILAFDEHSGKANVKVGKRRFRVATIEGCDRITRPCFRVRFTDGREVVASSEHLWLKGGAVGKRNGYRLNVSVPGLTGREGSWIGTADLRPGTEIRDLGEPWEEESDREAGYLAGVFDGEASLRSGPGFLLAFSQNPGMVMDRVVRLLEQRGYRPTAIADGPRRCGVTTVRGAYDTLRFLGAVRPHRLVERVPEWVEGRAAGRCDGKGVATVESVESIGEQEVVAVGTSTKTLFAEGLFSHNSVNMAAIDHLPDGRLSRSFAERFPGRVYLVGYSSGQRDVLSVDDEQRRIMVRRVEAIDATLELIRRQRHLLPAVLPPDFPAHLMSAIRIVNEDDLGRMSVAYRKTGPDDYLHACVYEMVAAEAWHIRQQVAESQREVFQPLDEMLEFSRARLDDDEMGYNPGPADDYESW